MKIRIKTLWMRPGPPLFGMTDNGGIYESKNTEITLENDVITLVRIPPVRLHAGGAKEQPAAVVRQVAAAAVHSWEPLDYQVEMPELKPAKVKAA